MIIDYSLTINSLMTIHYLEIDDVVNEIAEYKIKIFHISDHCSAYHLVDIKEKKFYTAFEARINCTILIEFLLWLLIG